MLVPEKSKIETEYDLLKDSTLVDDKTYEILQGQNIEKGEVIVIDLIDITKPGAWKKITFFIEKNSVPFFVGSATGLILILILIISFLRTNNKKVKLNQNQNIYIDKIIELDKRFEKNEINEEEYKILRENYKKNIKG
jgi:arginyl-tRNA--protein-N-Asp/Glu arginylyltransferase